MHYERSPNDIMSSDHEDDFGSPRLMANQYARELSFQRVQVHPTDAITPVTPVVPSTPLLAAHIYGDSSMIGDLELAANLGKALLLANRKLESEVKENQTVIDDQSQEIAYLTKQTSALREANETRLRIYEQLEVSIQDLEQTNQRFRAESSADKKKIKSLLETVDQLESKCEQLHNDLEEGASHRGRRRNKSHAKDERCRRSLSCENSLQITGLLNEDALRSRLEEVENKLKESQSQRLIEVRSREDFEVEVACLTQDNHLLREQLVVFKEREDVLRSIEEDFSSMDDTSSGLCRKCNNLLETASNHTMHDMDNIEEDDIDNIRGPCSLFRLRNGGFAYGSHESLGSLGRMLNSEESSPSSVAQTESQPNSIFSELNVEYWSAMSKCEKLIKQREVQNNSYMKEMGPNREPCIRCPTCTCEMRPDLRPKSILEEFSEVDSASSGFSEADHKMSSKSTQTEETSDDVTPTISHRSILDHNDSTSTAQGLPEYRKILHEVYYNIKQIVDHDKLSGFKPKSYDNTVEPATLINLPALVDETDSTSTEMVAHVDEVNSKPTRPDSLEIEPRPTSRQKRRRRNKNQLVSIKHKEVISNPSDVLQSTENIQRETKDPNKSSSRAESPKATISFKKNRARRGCPHKIRNRDKARYQTNEAMPLDVASCAGSSTIVHPSIEVAKLRKLDMTYAQALKKSNSRSTMRK